MIFYDSRGRRKKIIRILTIVLSVGIFGLVISFIFGLFANDNVKVAHNVDIAQLYKYYYTPLNNKKLSITFDDGPNPTYTPAIVAILKKHDVPATFFFTGQNVLKYPELAREVSLAGFEIGNHTFSHSLKVHDSPKRLKNELQSTGRIITIATGKQPLFYRPPFLLNIGPDPTINPEIMPKESLLAAFNEGYIPVGADIDSRDWLAKSPEELLQNVLKESPKGHVILLHDGGYNDTKFMMSVLEKMIITLKADGYKFVPLKEVLLPPTEINITKNLSLGSTDAWSNNEVSLLQWFLYSENFLDYYSISGRFGADTREALENWQLQNKIVKVDGLTNSEYGFVDKKTKEVILASSRANKLEFFSPTQTELGLVWGLNGLLQRFDLMIVSSTLLIIKYIFVLIVALIILRISVILGLYIFSYFKNKNRHFATTSGYKGGVSVIIPAFNEEENIESSILSIIKNNYPEKEIIVVNDGSTDGTRQVVQNLQAKYPGQIKLIRCKNSGKANALNIGIKFSKYEVFVAMDADTIFAPNAIKNLVRHFDDETVGAVAGKVETAKSQNLLDIFQNIEYEVGQNIEKRAFASVNAVGVIPGPIGAWRKLAVIKCGKYSRETLVEDQDLTLALITKEYKVIYEPKAVAYTETPHTLKDFLKQRFRWIYGTFQCVWKYKKHFIKTPLSSFSLVILPNIVLFSVITPLFYPLVDLVLIFAFLFGSWQQVVITYLIFTGVDIFYSVLAFTKERKNWRWLIFIPIQRLYYRQIIYYVVAKGLIRAMEGIEESWGKVTKRGESQEYYNVRFENNPPLKTNTAISLD